MAKQRNAFMAGMFILVSVLLIGGILVAIRGVGRLVDPVNHRKVAFRLTHDVGGLRVGDEVRIGGVRVGEIKRIEIATTSPSSDPAVYVTFTVPTKYALRTDARLRIQKSVTNMSNLNIESLGLAGAELSGDAVLEGLPSSLDEVLADVRGAVGEARTMVTDLRTRTLPELTQTVAKFGKTADAVTVAAGRTGEFMVEAKDLIGDTKTDLRTTVANLAGATGSLKAGMPDLIERLKGFVTKSQATVQSIDKAIDDVRAAVADIKEVGASAKAVIAGNRGKLDGMIAALKTTSDNLKGASSEIRRSPWRLLYKPDDGEVGNLNLFDAARHFAEGANELNDAAQALRDAAHDKGADPDRVKRLMEQLEGSFKKFGDVEKSLWSKVRE